MNARLEALAGQRRELVGRSALCRLRLRRDAYAVRGAASWKQLPGTIATTPALRTMALSVAISLLGIGRAARVLLYAGRLVMVAKLARAAIGYARGRARLA